MPLVMGWRVCGDGVCIEKIEKPNNLKATKAEGPKQDRKNRLRTTMPEGGES